MEQNCHRNAASAWNTLHFKIIIKYKSLLQLIQARTGAYKSCRRTINTCETLGSQPKTSGKDIEQHVTSTRQKYTDDYVHNNCLKIVQSASTYTDTSILIWQTILDMQLPTRHGAGRDRAGKNLPTLTSTWADVSAAFPTVRTLTRNLHLTVSKNPLTHSKYIYNYSSWF